MKDFDKTSIGCYQLCINSLLVSVRLAKEKERERS